MVVWGFCGACQWIAPVGAVVVAAVGVVLWVEHVFQVCAPERDAVCGGLECGPFFDDCLGVIAVGLSILHAEDHGF